MARFVSRPDLNAYIAQTVGARAVDRLKGSVAAGARRRAPAGKLWESVADDAVRPSHVVAHGQLIPGNLRYQLRRMAYARSGRGGDGRAAAAGGGWHLAGGVELARKPRDPSLSAEQRIHCRCVSVPMPGAVARTIEAGFTAVQGTRAVAEVSTRFPRAAESEFGTAGDRAALFMSGAAQEVALRVRAAAARH